MSNGFFFLLLPVFFSFAFVPAAIETQVSLKLLLHLERRQAANQWETRMYRWRPSRHRVHHPAMLLCSRIRRKEKAIMIKCLKTGKKNIVLEESARFSALKNTLLSRLQSLRLVEMMGWHYVARAVIAKCGMLQNLLEGNVDTESGREHISVSP